MAPVFIFAKQVEDVIREGKGTIEIPEGTRISAAALDLIRDNKLKITHVPFGSSRPQGISSKATPEASTAEDRKPQEDVVAGTTAPAPAVATEAVSAEEVDAIVNRVIARLRQIKGEGDVPVQLAGAETPADDDDLVICRCEEITKGEIRSAIQNGMSTLNGIKRVTRAGMGLCQGQTCQRLVTQLLAEELGYSATEIESTTARAPVRPLPLAAFATG
jgi:bacterioferritin-associated ferredoxin